MHYSLQDIATIIGADIPSTDAVIDTLLIDSRKLRFPQNSLFFALEGPRRNGHFFIEELYNKGLRYFVISQNIGRQQYPDAFFLRVNDCLDALQQLAAHHRSKFKMDVIGITGSNGKTVVKEWLYQLLQADKRIVRSPKSYNSQIGVPLSVWQMSVKDELAVFEAGISQPGEMEKLERVIQPTIGVLTNIGTAHSEGFKSDEEKLREKLRLFAHSRVLICNGDDAIIREQVKKEDTPVFYWGRSKDNDVQVMSIEERGNQTKIILLHKEDRFKFLIPFSDAASVENAITCCAVLIYLGLPSSTIAERMKELQSVNMRLEFKKGINNCTIINDSYSSDVNSFSIALDFLQQQSKGLKKTVILSDFAETTADDNDFYSRIAGLLQQHEVNRFIGIGSRLQAAITSTAATRPHPFETVLYLDTDEFLQHFKSSFFKDEVILVKGSRVFEFENIVALLEQKVHQTILEINLDAVVHNFKAFQHRLKKDTKIMVMVKAFAYGSGGAEIAGLLQYLGADYLGVAYADEGVELRKAGISLPVMVLNTEEVGFDAITDHNLEPDIFSFKQLDGFVAHLKNSGLRNYPVHIEVETGMNRLGFDTNDTEKLGNYLRENEYVRVVSIFSHLVASEDEAEDAFSNRQYERLMDAGIRLQEIIGYKILFHIANSSAIARLTDLQMDMVRLGIGLYGVGTPAKDFNLQPALSLKSTVAQVKNIKKGETVSYNRRGVANEDSVIATVRIGYADGYSRRFGNGTGKMLVKGQIAPVIGTVCMDMVMLDVTHIGNVQEGDDVIIFGPGLPVTQLAESIGTIPYEIMTGISPRVKRVYWRE